MLLIFSDSVDMPMASCNKKVTDSLTKLSWGVTFDIDLSSHVTGFCGLCHSRLPFYHTPLEQLCVFNKSV